MDFLEGFQFSLVSVFDVFIIILLGVLFYQVIKKTEAVKIIIGILIIFLIALLADSIGLERTSQILKNTSQMLFVGLVFIFHPELRMTLKKIGGLTDFKLHEERKLLSSLEEAIFSMSDKKIGALIILDNDKKLAYQSENLTEIDAKCTKELIETIFHPNTALHDGAVIIHNDRIAYAGCKLPLSGKKREGLGHLGTRHLAAIENAEEFDLMAIVVSEETGNVSVVNNDGIYRVKSSKMFRRFFADEDEKLTLIERLKKIKK